VTTPLRILLLEDSIEDAELIQELLEADDFSFATSPVSKLAPSSWPLLKTVELTWFSPITDFLPSTAFPH
jgi:hypothetical protein